MLRSRLLRLAHPRSGAVAARSLTASITAFHTTTATVVQKRFQSGSSASSGVDEMLAGPQIISGNVVAPVTHEQVWSLWNEGNLFSLQLAQMREFLSGVGIATDPAAKKAAVVRRLEEYLQAKDKINAAAVGDAAVAAAAAAAGDRGGQGQDYGNWASSGATQPETLLDLAQAGFYQGATTMVPRAFQLLTVGSSAEAVVSRVNTAAFPGFPANTECYTLSASDAEGALQARYSKVLQWCLLNMSNLRMDGELSVEVGKLLLTASAMRHNERVVSAYTLQQRMQLTKPYTWISSVPESAIGAVEKFLAEKGFDLVSKNARLTYEGTIKRANDSLEVVLNEHTKVDGVYGAWVDVQTAFCTSLEKPDLLVLLRSRAPVSAQDRDTYSRTQVIELAQDDVSDVLPPEHGQLVYLSENESRHFERLNAKGIAIVVREIKRQPLIVLRDDEEDARVEYRISVDIPASAGSHTMDVRAVGLEVLTLAEELSAAVQAPFNEAYGLTYSPSASS
ncbi:putative guide RNA associated protein GAP2 [Leptomonas pyrrhocoris]|uniref:Putative guide RNA associated protein GAP2 n=1 Tax=Leptomonas pyrrhocoris TaxID=157538 RepID=A0A0N0DZT5_LEPPY|nr:putative guide RNA associated protein GAP2 [Leptomonas pyrrhocoris]XP_015664108.1 putative guide RNA associated protein GAP2 [Leptomonas pyrrhocoris]KPA85668.1 putative guide RNA associated protein GAP2 [Leptomonas pyrrhocoris]KPA85669.1 putative guide RNA associated protein GAP2 [Leptomonas pyrrhocoris]|eukprot:XP_015664107.1 putative guide RNA associated protein GAP2 [Leptomonas pyrrhocoris]